MIFTAIKRLVDRVMATITVLLMILLVICVVWQVVSRYVLNQPSTFTDELARFLMIWVGLLGAAYTVGVQRHLSIDLFSQSLSPRRQALLTIIINSIIFLFSGLVMVMGGVKLINRTLETAQLSAAMQIPVGYVYFILPVSGLMIMFYSLWFIYCELQRMQLTEKELP